MLTATASTPRNDSAVIDDKIYHIEVLDEEDQWDVDVGDPSGQLQRLLGFVGYTFVHSKSGRRACMTFIVVNDPNHGPTTVNRSFVMPLKKGTTDQVPVMFDVDDKHEVPVRADYLTAQNSSRIFGHWFDAQGNPTKHNPEQITRATFHLRYMHHLQDKEPQTPIVADLSSNGGRKNHQTVGPASSSSAVDGLSTDTTPGPLLRNFKSSTLTDGTFLVDAKLKMLEVKLLDRKETVSKSNNDRFDELEPGLFAILPDGIDLTTVEILTFFPGYLKDLFFLYRCIAAGWTPKALRNALWKHRNDCILDQKSSKDRIYDSIKKRMDSNLRFLTRDMRATMDVYEVLRDNERSVVADYTRENFAMTYVANVGHKRVDRATGKRREDDLNLAQIYSGGEHIRQMPEGDDAGTLTALVHAIDTDQIGDLKMSEVADYVANLPPLKRGAVLKIHDAVMDRVCALRWSEEDFSNSEASKS